MFPGMQGNGYTQWIDKFGVINVKDYGVVPNSSLDQTSAIQNAINSTPVNGRLFFPPGTYLYSTVSLKQPMTLVGAGRFATTLSRLSPSLNGIVLNADAITVQDMGLNIAPGVTITGGNLLTSYNNSGGAFAVHHFTARRLVLTGAVNGSDAIGGLALWYSQNTHVEDILIAGTWGGGAVSLYGAGQSVVTTVRTLGTVTYATGRPFIVDINTGSDVSVTNCLASGIQGTSGMTQTAACFGMESTSRGQITGCSAINNTTVAGSIDGITVDTSGSSPNTEITVANNVCRNNSGSGIDVYNSDNVTLSGNVCTDNGDDGLEAFTSNHVILQGNIALRNKNQGIHVAGSSVVQLTNNQCRENNNNGIAVQANGSTLSNQIQLTSNVCTDNNQIANTSSTPYQACGISLQSGATDVQVVGNVTKNLVGTTQLYGIGLFNTGWANLKVIENNTDGNASVGINNDAAGDIRVVGVSPEDSLAGTSAGTVYYTQSQNGASKHFVAYANGYENDSTTDQTITFPVPFNNPPVISVNTTGLTLSASTTTLTITAPDATTTYSGVVEVIGI